MDTYLFFSGHAPELSHAELVALTNQPARRLLPGIFLLDLTEPDLDRLKKLLGGTVKIARVILKSASLSLKNLEQEFIKYSAKNLAVTEYGGSKITPEDIKNLKSRLVMTRPTRFLSLGTQEHSLVALSKKHAQELCVLYQGTTYLAETIWIHDFNSWKKRDLHKPYRDLKKGMIPPKLGRIMLNLALRGNRGVVADPFCGTGTIGIEGLFIAGEVIASDTDSLAVQGARANLTWAAHEFTLSTPFSTQVLDATHLDEHFSAVDAIVTEPFMGALVDDEQGLKTLKGKRLTVDALKNIILGLEKLYKGSLKSWVRVLKPAGRVVIAVPNFSFQGRTYALKLFDTVGGLGYNIVSSTPYTKPGAFVTRVITVLERT